MINQLHFKETHILKKLRNSKGRGNMVKCQKEGNGRTQPRTSQVTSQRGSARRAKITEVETEVQTGLGRGQERIQMGGQVSRCDLENPAGSQFRALEYWRGVVGRLFTCIKLSH